MISVQIGFNVFTLAIELNQRGHCSSNVIYIGGEFSGVVAVEGPSGRDGRVARTTIRGSGDLSSDPTSQWTNPAKGNSGKFDTLTFPILSAQNGKYQGRSNRFVESSCQKCFIPEPVASDLCHPIITNRKLKTGQCATRISEINQIFLLSNPFVRWKKHTQHKRIGFHLSRLFDRLLALRE